MLRTARLLLWLGVVGVMALAVARTRQSAEPLEHLGEVGSFAFHGRDGRAITDQSLAGRVWVVACFFTECTESCPVLAGRMQQLQADLAKTPDVFLVSLSVDPDRDTPARLDEYAKSFAAGERWLFCTATRPEVEAFVRDRLRLALEENTAPGVKRGERILHSSFLTLVDRHGAIRGQYDGTDAAALDRLRMAVQQIARE